MKIADMVDNIGALHTTFDTFEIYNVLGSLLYRGDFCDIPVKLKRCRVINCDFYPGRVITFYVPAVTYERPELSI